MSLLFSLDLTIFRLKKNMNTSHTTVNFRLILSELIEDKKTAYSKVVNAGFQISKPEHDKIIGDLKYSRPKVLLLKN
jgi:hypothetical protein